MSPFSYVVMSIVTIGSAARLSRLVTTDTYPPSAWIRVWWDDFTHDGPWSDLVHCAYCFTVWTAAFVVGWGVLFDWPTCWWIVNGALAAAYAAAILQVHDGSGS